MPGRFRNRSGIDMFGAGAGRWMWERLRAGLPKPPVQPIRGVAADIAYLQSNRSETSLTWIGHSSLLFQLDGVNFLIDPVFSQRASPMRFAGPKRHQPPGLAISDLPRIDCVVLSHGHYDHCDQRSLRAIAKQPGGPPHFVVPSGLDAWLTRQLPRSARDDTVQGMAWDDCYTMPGRTGEIALHFLSVQHWSNRSLFDRNDALWGSWAFVHPHFRFWYSGDLGYSDEPRAIGAKLGPFDEAAIAIGAYEPRWFMRSQHVNPSEAVQVMLDVQAAHAVGVHWGTFELTDEPLDQPPRDLADALAQRALPADRFEVLRHGETRCYPRSGSDGAAAVPPMAP